MKSIKVIALIGPSGSGKSTLAHLVAKQIPKISFIKSYTTRPQRSLDDQSHVFIDNHQFDNMQKDNRFIGVHQAFGYRYGQPYLSADTINLCLLRAPVVDEFTKGYPDTFIIEIDAPLQILKTRLKQRGSEERIDQKTIEQEIAFGRQLANQTITTDQPIEQSLQELTKLIQAII